MHTNQSLDLCRLEIFLLGFLRDYYRTPGLFPVLLLIRLLAICRPGETTRCPVS